jgi:hypothetical protein
LEDYDLAHGGLLGIGMFCLFISPFFATTRSIRVE